MSLFQNHSFVYLLTKQLGLEGQLDPESQSLIQALVENQTRKLLESATKFMINQKRQQLIVEDLENGVRYLGHKDIKLIPGQDQYHRQQNGSIRIDPIIENIDQYIKQQLKGINHLFREPQIKARWVYINEVVPKTEQNISIKNLKLINDIKSKQQEERNKKFNIIRDTPLSLLTTQQQQFFKLITLKLQENIVPQLASTNINHIFPFIINYIVSSKVNSALILFLLQIIKNKYCQKNIEVYLHQILAYLIGYQGEYAWEVGIQIANLIYKWGNKYKILYNLMNVTENIKQSYSDKIKKIAIQVIFGVDMKISTINLEKDIEENVNQAKEFLNILNRCARKLYHQNQYHKFLTEGYAGIENDCYLDLNL